MIIWSNKTTNIKGKDDYLIKYSKNQSVLIIFDYLIVEANKQAEESNNQNNQNNQNTLKPRSCLGS